MCADIDCYPHLCMRNTLQYDRRNSWANSTSSSSSSTTTTSWFERKLFSHFKRSFRRKSSSLTSNSSLSSRRPSSTTEDILSSFVDEQPPPQAIEEEAAAAAEVFINNTNLLPSPAPPASSASPIDLLYDYDRLLARCLARQEHDRREMILRGQTPVSIPHADLFVSQSRTIVMNWKSYVRLFRTLLRDPHLFEQYLNEYFVCQSSLNAREQLTLTIRTNKSTFDHLLRKFLDEYVTCLICQTAQTHLIKSDGIWRIECQLCGSQRTVKRLRWKHQHQ